MLKDTYRLRQIERLTATLNQIFDPPRFGIRRVTVPDTREQNNNATGINLLSFMCEPRFKITFSLANIDYLISVKYAAVFPGKVVIYRMASRWILASRKDALVANCGRGTLPGTLLSPVRKIDKVIGHGSSDLSQPVDAR